MKNSKKNSKKREQKEKKLEYWKKWRERKLAEQLNGKPDTKNVSPSPSPPPPEEELASTTPSRRPSRQAALNAAKKIHETICNYGSPSVVNTMSEVFVAGSENSQSVMDDWEIDLVMECTDEHLSPVQAKTLFQAQHHYNTVMKTLRNLEESNVKIICIPEEKAKSENLEDEEELSTITSNDVEKIIFARNTVSNAITT